MTTPRVAAIHDMSGFGRCSLTVAIPILSAMGVQCCPLPTAFLSTHTGGFEGFTFLDMTDEMPRVAAHWARLGLEFQAIYSGFLGSERQIGIVEDFIRPFRRPDTVVVVDPSGLVTVSVVVELEAEPPPPPPPVEPPPVEPPVFRAAIRALEVSVVQLSLTPTG